MLHGQNNVIVWSERYNVINGENFMILIFGGAFQGKLEYAKENFNIKSVYECGKGKMTAGKSTEAYQSDDSLAAAQVDSNLEVMRSAGSFSDFAPDFTADAVCALEKFVLECVRDGREAADFFRENKEKWQDKILIMNDVSQGIVPMDAQLRAFREMNGRLMLYLADEADEVIRVFCGIGKKVK